jgi:hypothetical protein
MAGQSEKSTWGRLLCYGTSKSKMISRAARRRRICSYVEEADDAPDMRWAALPTTIALRFRSAIKIVANICYLG